ncbi:hypothetical protein ACHHRT_04355 [Desulfurivibrio sp. D14AmB]|uniref:hypothetical protein n=1 Tax=Desulfurivibrio sp. D14AmB TaxID=3374370 RepID=UPI00376ECCB8
MPTTMEQTKRKQASRGWAGLLLGLGLFWLLTWVVLPWGQNLPGLQPVMAAIIAADVDTSTYWYSQSEKTAGAENHIRNALRH